VIIAPKAPPWDLPRRRDGSKTGAFLGLPPSPRRVGGGGGVDPGGGGKKKKKGGRFGEGGTVQKRGGAGRNTAFLTRTGGA